MEEVENHSRHLAVWHSHSKNKAEMQEQSVAFSLKIKTLSIHKNGINY
jgi:hypothetical protein